MLRDVVEEYLEEESKARIFSTQAAMGVLTDIALWMDFGPRGMMNMLNRLSAGELRIRARLRSTPDANAPVLATDVPDSKAQSANFGFA